MGKANVGGWEVPLAQFVCKSVDLTHCRKAEERLCQGRSLGCGFAEHSAQSASVAIEACWFWDFEVDREQHSTVQELIEFCRYVNVVRHIMAGAFGVLYKRALRLIHEAGAESEVGKRAKALADCIRAAEAAILPVVGRTETTKRRMIQELRRGLRSANQHDPEIAAILRWGQAGMESAIRSLAEVQRKGIQIGELIAAAGEGGNT